MAHPPSKKQGREGAERIGRGEFVVFLGYTHSLTQSLSSKQVLRLVSPCQPASQPLKAENQKKKSGLGLAHWILPQNQASKQAKKKKIEF